MSLNQVLRNYRLGEFKSQWMKALKEVLTSYVEPNSEYESEYEENVELKFQDGKRIYSVLQSYLEQFSPWEEHSLRVNFERAYQRAATQFYEEKQQDTERQYGMFGLPLLQEEYDNWLQIVTELDPNRLVRNPELIINWLNWLVVGCEREDNPIGALDQLLLYVCDLGERGDHLDAFQQKLVEHIQRQQISFLMVDALLYGIYHTLWNNGAPLKDQATDDLFSMSEEWLQYLRTPKNFRRDQINKSNLLHNLWEDRFGALRVFYEAEPALRFETISTHFDRLEAQVRDLRSPEQSNLENWLIRRLFETENASRQLNRHYEKYIEGATGKLISLLVGARDNRQDRKRVDAIIAQGQLTEIVEDLDKSLQLALRDSITHTLQYAADEFQYIRSQASRISQGLETIGYKDAAQEQAKLKTLVGEMDNLNGHLRRAIDAYNRSVKEFVTAALTTWSFEPVDHQNLQVENALEQIHLIASEKLQNPPDLSKLGTNDYQLFKRVFSKVRRDIHELTGNITKIGQSLETVIAGRSQDLLKELNQLEGQIGRLQGFENIINGSLIQLKNTIPPFTLPSDDRFTTVGGYPLLDIEGESIRIITGYEQHQKVIRTLLKRVRHWDQLLSTFTDNFNHYGQLFDAMHPWSQYCEAVEMQIIDRFRNVTYQTGLPDATSFETYYALILNLASPAFKPDDSLLMLAQYLEDYLQKKNSLMQSIKEILAEGPSKYFELRTWIAQKLHPVEMNHVDDFEFDKILAELRIEINHHAENTYEPLRVCYCLFSGYAQKLMGIYDNIEIPRWGNQRKEALNQLAEIWQTYRVLTNVDNQQGSFIPLDSWQDIQCSD